MRGKSETKTEKENWQISTCYSITGNIPEGNLVLSDVKPLSCSKIQNLLHSKFCSVKSEWSLYNCHSVFYSIHRLTHDNLNKNSNVNYSLIWRWPFVSCSQSHKILKVFLRWWDSATPIIWIFLFSIFFSCSSKCHFQYMNIWFVICNRLHFHFLETGYEWNILKVNPRKE